MLGFIPKYNHIPNWRIWELYIWNLQLQGRSNQGNYLAHVSYNDWQSSLLAKCASCTYLRFLIQCDWGARAEDEAWERAGTQTASLLQKHLSSQFTDAWNSKEFLFGRRNEMPRYQVLPCASSVPEDLHILSHLIVMMLSDVHMFNPHFTDKKIKAGTGEETLPSSHS